MKKQKLHVIGLALMLILCMTLTSCSYFSSFFAKTEASKKDESALADEIGAFSDTYTGALSEETYNTPMDAACAFVYDEVAGEDEKISNLRVDSEGYLTADEIRELGIADALPADAVSVEKYTATWASQDSDAASALTYLSTKEDETPRYVIYVIGGDNWFKYFSPVVETGETVTKSYYDSIFFNEKFKNCTLRQTVDIDVKVSQGIISQTSKITMTSTVKYADNCILFEQDLESDMEGIESSSQKIFVRLNEEGSLDKCYLLENGVWQRAMLSDSGILKPFGNQYLHYSYFTKTDYGCALEKENLAKYFKESVSMELNGAYDLDSMETKGYVNYYVADGVLSGLLSNIVVTMDYQGAKLTETVTSKATCTEYGTTVVTDPTV